MTSVDSAAQTARAVLMVEPQSFGWNPETGPSNRFQVDTGEPPDAVSAAAVAEFATLCSDLRVAGVEVHVIADRPMPRCPDAVFPNNWVSFHADGTVVLYPMLAPNRRIERRPHRLYQLVEQGGFEVTRLIDLTHHELEGRYLEGTGSVVFDHAARVAFACLSPRTHGEVLDELCEELGYRTCVFGAVDRSGVPVYHTNVLLAIGRRFAVVCADAIDAGERARVLEELGAHRDVIAIDYAQLHAFAGNMLELASGAAKSVLAVSRAALESLSDEQFAQLSSKVDTFVTATIPTIERLGGGSVRCMLAEIFLPRRASSARTATR
jgi:hypothetical protein